MNLNIVFSIVVGLWTIFVIYCLFNGTKILVKTKPIKQAYWIISAITADFIIYYFMGITTCSIILMIIMLLVTALYISIPSGYNNEGIYIRGLCFPYRKIEDMNVEKIMHTNRLNFKCYYRIFYIDCDDYATLRSCENVYKEAKYR